jgi:hypothetical protein
MDRYWLVDFNSARLRCFDDADVDIFRLNKSQSRMPIYRLSTSTTYWVALQSDCITTKFLRLEARLATPKMNRGLIHVHC